ncbi:hypothetical protein [Rhodobacter calidifons]|uniref:Uncharacterized protein n=1 Tax=Rhodobacter calidifons TaxID=2715277 RepID=A0ABX0GAE4_9RHOB|nr:hypothetical protein [Rhodobacter calidifons]NHB78096.1 hypothetical protein [Rhodobacter calidifons]
MIRLIGSLILFAVMAGGYLYFDFHMSAKWAGREDAEGLTFSEYVSGLTGRVAGLAGAANAAGMPTKLADMLPRPPEGWTVRAAVPDDVKPFLPKSTRNADRKAIASLEGMVDPKAGSGTETVTLAYEKGDRTVLIAAVRYPNVIFTSFAAMQQRMELQMRGAEFRGTEFMTVRGLDVTEDLLPEGFRGRLFLADVGAQIHLRVLAPKRMKDAELLPFFQTLHVEAMNASVIDKVEGLGKVPVIVLASSLEQAEREAYLADRDARAAAEAEREAEGRAAAEQAGRAPGQGSGGGFLGGLFGGGEAQADPAPEETGKDISCTTGKDGVKRCKVDGD